MLDWFDLRASEIITVCTFDVKDVGEWAPCIEALTGMSESQLQQQTLTNIHFKQMYMMAL